MTMTTDEALRRLAQIVARWALSSLDRYEEIADAFYRETGYMAPGKSVPPAMYQDPDERDAAWDEWTKREQAINVAALALAQQALREAADHLAAPVVEPHQCQSWPGGWTCHICGKHYTVAAPNDERTHITWDKDGNRVVTPLDSEGRRLAAHPRRCSKCPCRWDGAPQACPECGGPSVALARADTREALVARLVEALDYPKVGVVPYVEVACEDLSAALNMLRADHLAAPVGEMEEAFRFRSFQHWVNAAAGMPWTPDGTGGSLEICADTKGRICRNGGDFMRARDEDAFPVIAYRIVGVRHAD